MCSSDLADVDFCGPLRIVLGTIHVRPRRRMQNEPHSSRDVRRRKKSHIPDVGLNRDPVRKHLRQRRAELAGAAGDQDAAAVSRGERRGDRVLQRSTTRGSFQGWLLSSGSAGSNSSVTR